MTFDSSDLHNDNNKHHYINVIFMIIHFIYHSYPDSGVFIVFTENNIMK